MAEVPVPYNEKTHGPIPKRFIDGCKGDMVEAARRWSATAEWRRRESIDGLLMEPQLKVHLMRATGSREVLSSQSAFMYSTLILASLILVVLGWSSHFGVHSCRGI